MNRYNSFMKIIETGSFTRAAEELGYTQSAISQMIRSLEDEFSTKLLLRSRKGITLTPDGKEIFPYIKNIYYANNELKEKLKEMHGLERGIMRIGTFSSVSSNWLPQLIKDFKDMYPSVNFELRQGDYTSIAQWVKEGGVDFGFTNPDAVTNLTTVQLKTDEMLAVLPTDHSLAMRDKVTLAELSREPFILLDEGQLSGPLEYFKQSNLYPDIQYKVYDDYTIMSMVEKGLGIAILPKLIVSRLHYNIVIKEVSPPIFRNIAIAYKDKNILPIASRHFIDYIIEQFRNT